VRSSGTLEPDDKAPEDRAAVRRAIQELRDAAPDQLREGWAEMYPGLTLDNFDGDRIAAPAHYQMALEAGENGGDLLLVHEALRHPGDHDHDEHHVAQRRSRSDHVGLCARSGW
jgi:hypothetical protein